MKKILSFLFLLYTISVQALTITNDMLDKDITLTQLETIEILPLPGYEDDLDAPHFSTGGGQCATVSFRGWAYTPLCGDKLTITYAGTITRIKFDLSTKYTLTVVNGTGSGSYAEGTQVSITANVPPAEQIFDKWTGDVSGVYDMNAAGTTFTMESADATITATYKNIPPPTYTLIVWDGYGSGDYPAGTQVPITASPYYGQVFDKWTSDSGGSFADATSASTTFTMPAVMVVNVTANYKDAPAPTYTLTVISGSGSGDYPAGEQVPIVANTPANGKVFDQWTSDSGSFTDANSASTTFMMPTGAATVTATYKDAPASVYTLTVIGGTGSGNYEAGTEVVITANTPANGKVFDRWTSDSGSFADATSTSTVFTMPAGAATVTATYKDAPASVYTLTVIDGTGSGNYTTGTQIPIVANTPASGKVFDRWTSDSGSFADATSAGTTFTMPATAATVTATYKDAPASVYTLTVIGGSGSGNYTAGTQVPIVANTPASGKIFDTWTSNGGSFADANSAGTTFTMPSGATTVTATYKDDIPDGTGEASDNELSVRGIEKGLYIRSSKDGTAHIYTVSGRLVKAASYHAGENKIDVPAGIRIVRVGGRMFKVYVK